MRCATLVPLFLLAGCSEESTQQLSRSQSSQMQCRSVYSVFVDEVKKGVPVMISGETSPEQAETIRQRLIGLMHNLDRVQARVEALASILVGLRDHFPTIGKRVDGTLLNAADLDEHDFKWLLAVREAVALPLEDDGAAFARAIALDSNFKASGFVLEDSPPATRTVSDCI